MAVDMLSATVPLAMSAAAVLAGGRMRERRRRRALNRALHELRRPLQALVLAADDPLRVDPVIEALADLDGAINGAERLARREPVELHHLAEATVERWASCPGRTGRTPRLRWHAGTARVLGDRAQLARALDNLLANAIEHGRGPIELVGAIRRDRLRVLVRNGGAARVRRREDPRRGHGLEIVDEVARAHRGRFVLRRSASATLAVLDLPLADGPRQAPPDAA